MTRRTLLLARRAARVATFALAAACALLGPAAAQTGIVAGRVLDAETREPLAGANVLVAGTTQGAAAGADGTFRIAGVPAGRITLVARFLGYRTDSVAVQVTAGGTARQDFLLAPDGFTSEGITVTGLLEGQQAAIAQQRESSTIVNVVPEDRLRELPDQNAAESLGRLPGVAVQRDAGEGQKVVIRGLSPRFNAVTVNGQRLPGTDGSDRSVDLSTISPDQLSGIEVYKAITPDQDADAIGGAVNFVIGRVAPGLRGDVRLLGGYNSQAGTVDQVRGNASVSTRVLDGAVGVGVAANVQRASRDADLLDAGYVVTAAATDTEPTRIGVDDVRLGRTFETRERLGGSLALDWAAPGQEVVFNASYGRLDRAGVRVRKRYRVGESRVEYDFADRDQSTDLLTASLRGSHRVGLDGAVPGLTLAWNSSASRSATETPFQATGRFRELSAFDPTLVDREAGLEGVLPAARNNLDATFLERLGLTRGETDETSLAGQLDLQLDLALGGVTGFVKTGVKLRDLRRRRDFTNFEIPQAFAARLMPFSNPDRFALAASGEPLIANFIREGQVYDGFIPGFDLGPVLDTDALRGLAFEFRDIYRVNVADEVDDYEADERVTAAYAMTQLNALGGRLMVMPGVRVERTRGDYATFRLGEGEFDDEGLFIGDIERVEAAQSYTSLFPMAHVRVRPAEAFDVRYAYTETIARPNYFSLVPFERVRPTDRLVERGNPDLVATRARNHDLFLTLYTQRAGLVTLGVFTKSLSNVDFPFLGRLETDRTSPFFGFRYNEFVNSSVTTRVRGAEAEWQTNLAWLPGPLAGVLFSANATLTDSETSIPFIELQRRLVDGRPTTVQIDTLRTVRLIGQPALSANLTLGYERGGFTGRLSMNLQDDASRAFAINTAGDSFADTFSRWDLALSQRVTDALQVYANLNSIGAPAERAFQGPSLPTSAEYYGWTGDLGLRYRF